MKTARFGFQQKKQIKYDDKILSEIGDVSSLPFQLRQLVRQAMFAR